MAKKFRLEGPALAMVYVVFLIGTALFLSIVSFLWPSPEYYEPSMFDRVAAVWLMLSVIVAHYTVVSAAPSLLRWTWFWLIAIATVALGLTGLLRGPGMTDGMSFKEFCVIALILATVAGMIMRFYFVEPTRRSPRKR